MFSKFYFFVIFILLSTASFSADLCPPDTVEDGYAVKKYFWLYNIPWEWNVEVPIQIVNYYQQKPRPKWTGDFAYYSKYIDPSDKGIQYVAKALKETMADAKVNYKWTKDQEIMFIISMIQQIRYVPDSVMGVRDYEKYPVETLFDGYGDCEDKAILGAALLKKLGFDVVLIFLETPDHKRSHIALGVEMMGKSSGNYFQFLGKKYYYIETTYAGWHIGEIPEEWAGLPAVMISVD